MPLSPSLAAVSHIPGPPALPVRLGSRLVDALFPPRCAACRRVGAMLCPACLERVQPVPTPVCRRCGAPVRGATTCVHCQTGSFHVSAIRAAGVYGHPLSTAIQQFKYNGQRGLYQPLGRMLAQYWLARDVSADIVVPVPLHAQRLRERGYNQARLLALEFCRRTRLPLLDGDILRRERETQRQVLLGVTERRQNVAGAFAWHGPALGGVKVLLIDDVATTGSTLEACGEALIAAGAAKVWALTVARAAHAPWAAR